MRNYYLVHIQGTGDCGQGTADRGAAFSCSVSGPEWNITSCRGIKISDGKKYTHKRSRSKQEASRARTGSRRYYTLPLPPTNDKRSQRQKTMMRQDGPGKGAQSEKCI